MKNILIKVSGDLSDHKEFFEFATEKAKNNYVLVICGGGTKISSTLKKAGYSIRYDKYGRRVTKTWAERIIMRNVLEREEKRLQNKFVGKGVIVKAPIIYAESVLCPINGDDLAKAYYLGFNEVYVFTKKERLEKKKGIFEDYPRVRLKTL